MTTVEGGGVTCWGNDFFGETGNGTSGDHDAAPPAPVVGLDGVVEIKVGAPFAQGDATPFPDNTTTWDLGDYIIEGYYKSDGPGNSYQFDTFYPRETP